VIAAFCQHSIRNVQPDVDGQKSRIEDQNKAQQGEADLGSNFGETFGQFWMLILDNLGSCFRPIFGVHNFLPTVIFNVWVHCLLSRLAKLLCNFLPTFIRSNFCPTFWSDWRDLGNFFLRFVSFSAIFLLKILVVNTMYEFLKSRLFVSKIFCNV
jgi:hypothetical protein